jgi:hypothetical protein
MLQAFFESFGAITVRTCPTFRAIFMPTILAIVRVFDFQQLKIFLPVRPFFSQWRGAETSFQPMYDTVIPNARLPHVPIIFVTCN